MKEAGSMKNKMTVLDTFLIENCMAIFGLLAGIAMPKEKRKTAFTVGMAVFLLTSASIVYRVMKMQETEDLQIVEE